jgi:hypothetical protein
MEAELFIFSSDNMWTNIQNLTWRKLNTIKIQFQDLKIKCVPGRFSPGQSPKNSGFCQFLNGFVKYDCYHLIQSNFHWIRIGIIQNIWEKPNLRIFKRQQFTDLTLWKFENVR